MQDEVVILYFEELGEVDKRLSKLIEFLGVKHKLFSVREWMIEPGQRFQETGTCLMVSGRTLASLLHPSHGSMFQESLRLNHCRRILFYGLHPDESISRAVQIMTKGAIKSISRFEHDGYHYVIRPEDKNMTGPFCGLIFGPIQSGEDFGFEVEEGGKGLTPLIQIDGKPFMVRREAEGCEWFLIGCRSVLDIEQKIFGPFDVRKYFSQIVPEIMFLKYALGHLCWQNNNLGANLIIDDPLLHRNYGFLNYEELLGFMDSHHFSTTIALIPWNYKRTRQSVSKIFSGRPDKYSLCIHGYDHTFHEFGSDDFTELNDRLIKARGLMVTHQKRVGLNFDNVMVVPQGFFSTQAIQLLKSNNFLAAVNSWVLPHHGNKNREGIEISQLLDLAILKYHRFPLFTRRHPSDGIPNFAFDLLMGKPCLIVLHHDYFKQGYKELGDFIDKVNTRVGSLRWDGLGNILRNTYLKKMNPDGGVTAKMYGNFLFLENDRDEERRWTIVKEETNEIPIHRITIHGKEVNYDWDGHFIQFSLDIKPHERVPVEVTYTPMFPGIPQRERMRYKMKVSGRRYLSEIRDNVLSKNEFILRTAKKMGDLLNKYSIIGK